MRFSQSTELAVDSLLFMGAQSRQEEFAVEEVAAAQRVSPSYLAKIFQQLVKAGLLRSRRGAKGGYRLGQAPRAITLLDVTAAMEGASPLYDCNAQLKDCQHSSRCLILAAFQEAEQAMRDVLRRVTLADLLGRLARHRREAAWIAGPGRREPESTGARGRRSTRA